MKKIISIRIITAMTALLALPGIQSSQAASMFWDSNGAVAGAGTTPTGTWGTDNFWSTSSAGTVATPAYTTTNADALNFSAGTDANGPYTVTLNGTQYAQTLQSRTGQVTLTGGTLAMTNLTSSGTQSLYTNGATSLSIASTLLVNNSVSGNNFLNFTPGTGGTITINGSVTATNNAAANKIFIRQTGGTGTIIINSNLGSDAGFLTGLQAGNMDGASGTLTLNGAQSLGTTALNIAGTKNGTVNLGGTVNTGNAVAMGAISITDTAANMAGATVNVNSAVTAGQINIRNGGALNVAGSLTTTSSSFLGVGVSGAQQHGGAIKVLNGGTANLGTLQVGDSLVFTNAGTLNGTQLTLGESTGNTSGKFVLGDATGTGAATFSGTTGTALTTAGTGTSNAIVGGNAAVSTLTVNGAGSFSGVLGGGGANENNLALVKGGGGTTLSLSGQNTYTGNTLLTAGTLVLADDARLNFAIGANGLNNGISGSGPNVLTLNGDFTFDLTNAAATGSWNIVDIATLGETFGSTFSVIGFTDAGSNLWTKINGGSTYTFDESSGLLSAVPEPTTWALLAGAGTFVMVMRRRRRA